MTDTVNKAKRKRHDDHIMQDLSKPKTPMEYIRLFFSGFAMGSADIVPGVSGGTMAFILGVYETLIDAIKSFNLDAIRLAIGFKLGELFEHIPIRFLIALGLGILSAILLLASLLEGWLETQPTLVFAFFGGLIIASIIAVGAKVTWSPSAWVALVVGTIVAFRDRGLAEFGRPIRAWRTHFVRQWHDCHLRYDFAGYQRVFHFADFGAIRFHPWCCQRPRHHELDCGGCRCCDWFAGFLACVELVAQAL
jgi:hypothetical protein